MSYPHWVADCELIILEREFARIRWQRKCAVSVPGTPHGFCCCSVLVDVPISEAFRVLKTCIIDKPAVLR